MTICDMCRTKINDPEGFKLWMEKRVRGWVSNAPVTVDMETELCGQCAQQIQSYIRQQSCRKD